MYNESKTALFDEPVTPDRSYYHALDPPHLQPCNESPEVISSQSVSPTPVNESSDPFLVGSPSFESALASPLPSLSSLSSSSSLGLVFLFEPSETPQLAPGCHQTSKESSSAVVNEPVAPKSPCRAVSCPRVDHILNESFATISSRSPSPAQANELPQSSSIGTSSFQSIPSFACFPSSLSLSRSLSPKPIHSFDRAPAFPPPQTFPASLSSPPVLHPRPPPSPVVVSDFNAIGECRHSQETFRVASEHPQTCHESESTSVDQLVVPDLLPYDALLLRSVQVPNKSLRMTRSRNRVDKSPPPSLSNKSKSQFTTRLSFPQLAPIFGRVLARCRSASTFRPTTDRCIPESSIVRSRLFTEVQDLFKDYRLRLLVPVSPYLVQSLPVVRWIRQGHRSVDRVDPPSRVLDRQREVVQNPHTYSRPPSFPQSSASPLVPLPSSERFTAFLDFRWYFALVVLLWMCMSLLSSPIIAGPLLASPIPSLSLPHDLTNDFQVQRFVCTRTTPRSEKSHVGVSQLESLAQIRPLDDETIRFSLDEDPTVTRSPLRPASVVIGSTFA